MNKFIGKALDVPTLCRDQYYKRLPQILETQMDDD